MNKTPSEARAFARDLIKSVKVNGDTKIWVFPSFVSLSVVKEIFTGYDLVVGAQNVHSQKSGAFTGEVSVPMLKDMGIDHVIIGHSERRHIFGESDQFINEKVKAAISDAMNVILCIGETLEERQSGRTFDVIKDQLSKDLEGVKIEDPQRLTIAYEPVWAIGTGVVAQPYQAQEAMAYVRDQLRKIYPDIAEKISCLYGGSMNKENCQELFLLPDVDGGLIGGASLKLEEFVEIYKIATKFC
ncbi:MAG: triose-phosphate isomerase [Athalassotoga sp.]